MKTTIKREDILAPLQHVRGDVIGIEAGVIGPNPHVPHRADVDVLLRDCRAVRAEVACRDVHARQIAQWHYGEGGRLILAE